MDHPEISSPPSIFERCRDVRQQLLDLVSRIDDDGPQKAALSDTMERFMLWAGNLGAMRQPSSKLSLDQRLAKAPEVHGLICRHLDDIGEALDDLSSLLSGADSPDADDFKVSDQDAEEDEPFDEAAMILEVLAEAINSLFRLGILVRKASPTDRFKRALQMSDTSFNDAFDIGYVREKYPKMRDSEKDWLATRLGRLISQRRLFIKYSRDHKVRLQFQEPAAGDLPEQLATQTERQSSKATTFHIDRLPVSVLAPPPETAPELEEEDADEVMSVMSASTMSNSLSVLRLPTLADLSVDGKPFECPICFTLQDFRREKAWRVHAFRDLKAYVCTAGGSSQCNGEYFGDRNTWFEHELHHHRSKYTCTLCSTHEPVSHDVFLHHMAAHHPQVSGHQLRAVEDVSRQNPTRFDPNDCPFCDDWADQIHQRADPKGKRPATVSAFPDDLALVSATRFKRHVALHQEQLAIFALPRMVEDGEQAHEDGTDKSILSSQSPTDDSHGTAGYDRDPKWWRPGLITLATIDDQLSAAKLTLATIDAELTKATLIKPTYSPGYVLDLDALSRGLESLKENALSLVQQWKTPEEGRSRTWEAYALYLQTTAEIQWNIIHRIEREVKLLRSTDGQDPSHLQKCQSLCTETGNTVQLIDIRLSGAQSGHRDTVGVHKYYSRLHRMIRRAQYTVFNITRQHHGPSTAEGFLEGDVDTTLDELSPLSSESEDDSPYMSPTEDAWSTHKSDLKHDSTSQNTGGITIKFAAKGDKDLHLDSGCSWQEAVAKITASGHAFLDGEYDIKVTHDPLYRPGYHPADWPTVNQDNWDEWARPGSILALWPHTNLEYFQSKDNIPKSPALQEAQVRKSWTNSEPPQSEDAQGRREPSRNPDHMIHIDSSLEIDLSKDDITKLTIHPHRPIFDKVYTKLIAYDLPPETTWAQLHKWLVERSKSAAGPAIRQEVELGISEAVRESFEQHANQLLRYESNPEMVGTPQKMSDLIDKATAKVSYQMAQQLTTTGSPWFLPPMESQNHSLDVLVIQLLKSTDGAYQKLGKVQTFLKRLSRTLQSVEKSQRPSEISQRLVDIGHRASALNDEFVPIIDEIQRYRHNLSTPTAETLTEANHRLEDAVRRLHKLTLDAKELDDKINDLDLAVENQENQPALTDPDMSQMPPSQLSSPGTVAPLSESDASVTSSAQPDSQARTNSPGSDAAAAGSDQAISGRSPLVRPLLYGVPEMELVILDSQSQCVTLKAIYEPRLVHSVIPEALPRALGFKPEYFRVPVQIDTPRGQWKITGFVCLAVQVRDPHRDDRYSIIHDFSISPDMREDYIICLGSQFFEKPDGTPSLASHLLDGAASMLQASHDKTSEDSPAIRNLQNIDSDGGSNLEDEMDSSQSEIPLHILEDDYALWLLPETPGLNSTPRGIKAYAASSLCSEPLIDPGFAGIDSYQVHQLEQPKNIYDPPYSREPYQVTQYVVLRVYGNEEARGPSVSLRFYLCDKIHNTLQPIYLSPQTVELFNSNNVVKPMYYR